MVSLLEAAHRRQQKTNGTMPSDENKVVAPVDLPDDSSVGSVGSSVHSDYTPVSNTKGVGGGVETLHRRTSSSGTRTEGVDSPPSAASDDTLSTPTRLFPEKQEEGGELVSSSTDVAETNVISEEEPLKGSDGALEFQGVVERFGQGRTTSPLYYWGDGDNAQTTSFLDLSTVASVEDLGQHGGYEESIDVDSTMTTETTVTSNVGLEALVGDDPEVPSLNVDISAIALLGEEEPTYTESPTGVDGVLCFQDEPPTKDVNKILCPQIDQQHSIDKDPLNTSNVELELIENDDSKQNDLNIVYQSRHETSSKANASSLDAVLSFLMECLSIRGVAASLDKRCSLPMIRAEDMKWLVNKCLNGIESLDKGGLIFDGGNGEAAATSRCDGDDNGGGGDDDSDKAGNNNKSKKSQKKQDGLVNGNYVPLKRTLGLELVADPQLLGKNDKWEEQGSSSGKEGDANVKAGNNEKALAAAASRGQNRDSPTAALMQIQLMKEVRSSKQNKLFSKIKNVASGSASIHSSAAPFVVNESSGVGEEGEVEVSLKPPGSDAKDKSNSDHLGKLAVGFPFARKKNVKINTAASGVKTNRGAPTSYLKPTSLTEEERAEDGLDPGSKKANASSFDSAVSSLEGGDNVLGESRASHDLPETNAISFFGVEKAVDAIIDAVVGFISLDELVDVVPNRWNDYENLEDDNCDYGDAKELALELERVRSQLSAFY